jgi:gliding motility-associated-like protein
MLILLFGTQLGYSKNIPIEPPTKKSIVTTAPSITATGNFSYCPLSQTKIVSTVTISHDPSELTTDAVYIQIASGYVIGEDQLLLSNVTSHPTLTSSWNAVEGKLTLSSPTVGVQVNYSEFEAAIKDVVFYSSNPNPSGTRNFSISLGNGLANYLPSNGHYYEYVPNLGITWTNAKAAAALKTFYGLQGYLATLTALDEAQLAGKQAPGTGWIGGTDEGVEGVWKWATGPEAGTVFWRGTANGSSPNFAFWNTGEPNQSGDEDYAHITAPGVGTPGSWNDLSNTGASSGSYQPKGYIVEYGGMPGDPTLQLSASTTLSIGGQITATTPASNCGPGSVTLRAVASSGTINWYSANTGGTVLGTGISYTTTLSTTTSYYVATSDCTERTEIKATINPLPIVQNTSIIQCDIDLISDGKTVFNLTVNNDLISTNYTNENFAYYSTVTGAMNNLGTDLIPNQFAFENTTPTTMPIGVRVINLVTGCSAAAQITLIIPTTNFHPSSNFEFTICDDFLDTNGNSATNNNNRDGITTFDFSSTRAAILAQLPSSSQNYTVNYYRNQTDALAQLNPITDIANYRNIGYPNTQNIWVRIESNLDNSCVGLGPYISLNVEKTPNIELNSTNLICSNIPTFFVTLDAGFLDNSSAANFNYNWKKDGAILNITTPTLGVNSEGNYTVEVVNQTGCSRTRSIQVTASNSATITSIDIVDLVDSNTVTINTTGPGDYEYSMDYLNGLWQDSNFFSNVPGGIHEIFVNDKNGCGVVSKEITVLSIPKFFTPNNDSYNDFWTVKGMISYPNAELRIFDRYGKLLKELRSTSLGWDGTFNGQELPASDYWYVFKMDATAPEKRGHFSLKR